MPAEPANAANVIRPRRFNLLVSRFDQLPLRSHELAQAVYIAAKVAAGCSIAAFVQHQGSRDRRLPSSDNSIVNRNCGSVPLIVIGPHREQPNGIEKDRRHG